MSYARQYDDKPGQWFWMNPPDAQEGDECKLIELNPNFLNMWRYCRAWNEDDCRKNHPGNIQRRRLIQPGEGFRILGVDEVPPMTGFEATCDGINWYWLTNIRKVSITELLFSSENDLQLEPIIAIRTPIAVEPGQKNNLQKGGDEKCPSTISESSKGPEVTNGPTPTVVQTFCAGCNQPSDLRGLLGCCPECRLKLEQVQPPRTGLPEPGEAFIAKHENGNVIAFEKGMPSESRIGDYFSDKVIAWFPLADIKWIKVEDVKEDEFQAYWTPIADALLKNHTPDEVYEKRCVAEDAWTAASDKAREAGCE